MNDRLAELRGGGGSAFPPAGAAGDIESSGGAGGPASAFILALELQLEFAIRVLPFYWYPWF